MQPATKKPSLIMPVPTKQDAEIQYLMAKDVYEEKADSDSYANMCRAFMVMQTKTIELSPEELAELRGVKQ